MTLHAAVLKSEIWLSIKNIVERNEVEYISFDIFDTLLRRDCNIPIDIFKRVGEKALELGIPIGTDPMSFKSSRVHFEKKARLASVNEDVTLDEIYQNSPYTLKIQSQLKALEEQLENESLFADPIMEIILGELRNYDVKILITSDMYLSRKFLSEKLDRTFPESDFVKVFVSSETMLTKATGSMFIHILNELGITAENIVHIGDNRVADFERALECGLNALLYNVPKWVETVWDRENTYPSSYSIDIINARRTAALLMPANFDEEEKISYINGSVIHGPAIAGFVRWIDKNIKKHNLDQLLFLMREGEIYQKAYNYLYSEQNTSNSLFYASRKATFLPSINPNEFMENISTVLTRKNYTVKNLLDDLKVDYKGNNSITKYINEQVRYMLRDETTFSNLEKLLQDNLVKTKKLITDRKKAFNSYLEETINGQNYALVDYGAGGTINLQFNQSTESKPAHHFLFTASHRAFSKANEVIFTSFIPYDTAYTQYLHSIHRSPEIFEYFLTGLSTTTLDYELIEGSHEIKLCSNTPCAIKIKILEAFNKGVDRYLLLSKKSGLAEDTVESRRATLFNLARQVEIPTYEEANFIGSLQHEDNFGSDTSYTIIKPLELKELKEANHFDFWNNHKEYKTTKGQRFTWPQGVLTKVDSDFICKKILSLDESQEKHLESIKRICDELKEKNIVNVAIYGAGQFFDELELYLNAMNINIEFLIDKKAYFSTFKKRRYVVKSPEQSANSNIPVILASEAFIDEMINIINEFNISDNIIVG